MGNNPPTNVLKLIAKHLINRQTKKPPPPLIPGGTLGSRIRMRKPKPEKGGK